MRAISDMNTIADPDPNAAAIFAGAIMIAITPTAPSIMNSTVLETPAAQTASTRVRPSRMTGEARDLAA